jgi:hypothetical protein
MRHGNMNVEPQSLFEATCFLPSKVFIFTEQTDEQAGEAL